jgi:hypothetical protein
MPDAQLNPAAASGKAVTPGQPGAKTTSDVLWNSRNVAAPLVVLVNAEWEPDDEEWQVWPLSGGDEPIQPSVSYEEKLVIYLNAGLSPQGWPVLLDTGSGWRALSVAECITVMFAPDEGTPEPEPLQDVIGVMWDAIWTLQETKLDASQLGQPNGVASLDSNGKVPASQLPD